MCWHKWSQWGRPIPIPYESGLAQWRHCTKCNKANTIRIRTPQGINANLIYDTVKEVDSINKQQEKNDV